MITIIDYGMGNLRSVQKAFEYIGMEAKITSDREEILRSGGIVLPGVGAFPDAMGNLREMKMDSAILKSVEQNKPLLGICLGMQLLFDEGEEGRNTKGLGLIPGSVKRLEIDKKIPHMGWNTLEKVDDCLILSGIEEGSYAYFVHSYYCSLGSEKDLKACSPYGIKVPAVVGRGKVFGVQFHPEKSGDTGMRILRNFGELVG